MENMLLPFAVGLVVGALLLFLLLRFRSVVSLPSWTITDACLRADGQVQIDVNTVPTTTPAVQFVRFHAQVYRNDPGSVGAPGSSATTEGATSSFLAPNPTGTSSSTDCVVVWAEFTVFDVQKLIRAIPGCSGGSNQMAPRVAAPPRSGLVSEHFDAIPKAYRVSTGPAPPGAGGGPSVELVGELATASGVHLVYNPEASTPTEPVWTAQGGSGPVTGWTLILLHRHGGFGAVLSATGAVGGREVRFTWVTSEWRFHTNNRLTSEASEPGVPALLVSPA
jgi:hypothetical protein